jgi:hypothetical protein
MLLMGRSLRGEGGSEGMQRYHLVGLLILSTLITGLFIGTFHEPASRSDDLSDTSITLTYNSLVNNIIVHHKAPFAGNTLLHEDSRTQSSLPPISSSSQGASNSTLVNPNISSQTGIALAADPETGHDLVITTDSAYLPGYAFSTNDGASWVQKQLGAAIDPLTTIPYTFTHSTGVAFDQQRHVYITTIAGNTFSDTLADYANFDSQINIIRDTPGSSGASTSSTIVDYVPCHGQLALPALKHCQGQLDRPSLTINLVPHSPSYNTVYVYYTYFCIGMLQDDGTMGPCSDGALSIPAQSSVILEAHTTGSGHTFSSPALVSGPRMQAQFPSLVIDSRGTPHLFFEDFSDLPTIHLYESTLANARWSTHPALIASFTYNGLLNPNWHLRDIGTVAPACSAAQDMAYCAFSATAVAAKSASSTPDIYLAAINLISEKAQIIRVNVDTNRGKHHIFPQVAAAPHDIYVGWYDDAADQANARLAYVVSQSTTMGRTFSPPQQLDHQLFEPCSDMLSCLLLDNSSKLVIGSDSTVHAAWLEGQNAEEARVYERTLKA